MLQAGVFSPVFSPVLRDRKLSGIFTGVALLQGGLVLFGLSGWPCPFLHATGIPCPGCGLTRATVFLLQGKWWQSITFHAFAPLLVLGFVIIACIAVAPATPRTQIIRRFESFERKTGITGILLIGLIVYWLVRLLIFRSAFAQLMQG
jgi:hypothetical protein